MLKKHADLPSQNLSNLLINHGLKVTKPRLAVLEAFQRTKHPVSIQEIADGIKKGAADPVTVYRVIQALIKKNVIREVNLRHAHVDYELVDTGDHHHIVCVKCGLIDNFDGCGGEALARAALKRCPAFARVDEHAIELFGVCKTCA